MIIIDCIFYASAYIYQLCLQTVIRKVMYTPNIKDGILGSQTLKRCYGEVNNNRMCIKKQNRLKLMEDKAINKSGMNHVNIQSKNDGKYQESIQSSTIPDPGHHMRK